MLSVGISINYGIIIRHVAKQWDARSNKYLLCLKEEGSNSEDVYGLLSPKKVE